MTDAKKIAETLQDSEIAVLNALKSKKELSGIELIAVTKLQAIEIGRAGMWLENKRLIEGEESASKFIILDKLGEQYAKGKLPEKSFCSKLLKKDKLSLKDLSKDFEKDELNFCLGYLRGKGIIKINKGIVSLVRKGAKESLEELFLKKLSKQGEVDFESLKPEELFAYEELKKRKEIVKEIERKSRSFKITDLGLEVVKLLGKGSEKRIGVLNPSLIRTGDWKKHKLRRYDVSINVPKIFAGKKQAYLAFLDKVKRELVAMGFEEMTGPLVECEFFNNDSLFMPQDHPARGIHDAYFIKGEADLSKYKKEIAAVKAVHETGGKTASLGWRIPFSEQITKRLLLRSQGTALSARMLMSPDLKIPGKYFAVARCYRPDVVDPTHLTEFNQLEGIVLGDDVNFRKLLSLLANFAKKVANVDKIKFLPGYFPFTEPSVEAFIYLKELGKWTEVMPAGIFRPELTEPLGIKVPVIAWGIGIDRLFMIKEGINDIRYLFSSDLKWLRGANV